MKKIIVLLISLALLAGTLSVPALADGEKNDISGYLWELDGSMDEDAFEIARSRDYKIIKEMEPIFTEDSFHAVYAANVHLNQKKEGAREEFIQAVQDLQQVKSVQEGITFLWDQDNMPVYGNKEYTEEDLDAGQLDGYGFIPYMINYLLEDPTQAKGNILLFSGGTRTNESEGFPTAEVFNELGYNCFVVNCRRNPYTEQDADMDAQRAIRMVKYLGAQKGWGGLDMIALCGFSAGGLRVINNIENGYLEETPDQLGADAYMPDEADTMISDCNVGILIYTGKDDPLVETGHWPALFMVVGKEDGTGAAPRLENYYEQVKDLVPAALLEFEGAGHGFGAGQEGASNSTEECASWPSAADAFMQEHRGFVQNTAAETEGDFVEINATEETGDVTLQYYDGDMIQETVSEEGTLIQVPEGMHLDHVDLYSKSGAINIIGVMADSYRLETVDSDINVYLPEDAAFHVQLTTISDLFESDFLYDVGMERHEYLFGEDGVEIEMETIIGTARVMILK